MKKVFINNRVINSKKKSLKIDLLWETKFQKTNGHPINVRKYDHYKAIKLLSDKI